MAGTPGPTVEGGARLQRAFRHMADGLADMAPTHDAAVAPVLASARQAVPILTGALLDTLHVDPDDDGSAVIAGSPTVPYAAVINYGWPDRNIEAQPYLDEAPTYQDVVAAVYDSRVDDLIREFDRKAP
jgi:hypothetical protein